MEFYQQTLEDIYKKFGTHPTEGLAKRHVSEMRKTYGSNTLTQSDRTPWWKLLLSQFVNILVIILFVVAVVSALLGEYIDSIAIIIILLINGIIGFIQEYRAQASIESLQKLANSKATVIRNGKTQNIDAEDIVPGDILLLQTGDRIPADARLIETIILDTQEGALTGESVPVHKEVSIIKKNVGVGDQKNMLFSGTVITKGKGKAVVVATGMKTQIGKIANLIQQADTEETPLQKQLDKLGKKLGKMTLLICAIIFLTILLQQGSFDLGDFRAPFMLAVSLAVAAIPEGLPIVVTIALSIGTKRMASKNALVKQLPAVEALGSTTVICTDKTGTLTKNEMTVTGLYAFDKTVPVTGTGYDPSGAINGEVPHVAYNICALCNDAELIRSKGVYTVIGDPTEGCLVTLARKGGVDERKIRKAHPRIGEVPFDSTRKRMSTVHKFGRQYQMLTKGAPDVILRLCTHIEDKSGRRKITAADKKHLLAQNNTYAEQALRVLALAYKDTTQKKRYSLNDEKGLTFVSLVGMIDPPRQEAITAVAECKQAGIRVVMITGDHKVTAMAIADQLGIEGKAVTGDQLHKMQLKREIESIGVFARVNPEDKLRIVDALKEKGEIVAMTGDGVNDAPALKEADIGVAMGITGTDVAKESAAMILTDDNFASIVRSVEEGRNIYQNIKKFVNYMLSSNLAELLVILLAILLIPTKGETVWPLTVTMILYMNLLTDSLPALALGVDPGNPAAMLRPPRNPKEPIITKNMWWNIGIIGLLVSVATLLLFWFYYTYSDLRHAQTVALTSLVVLELVRLAMIRKQYNTPFLSNKWLGLSIILVFALQCIVLYVPFFHPIFKTMPLRLIDWILIILVSAVTYIVGMIVGSCVRKITQQED